MDSVFFYKKKNTKQNFKWFCVHFLVKKKKREINPQLRSGSPDSSHQAIASHTNEWSLIQSPSMMINHNK